MTPSSRPAGWARPYRRTWALRDCTLAIPEGHVVGLVGPNGAGKTTLLRLAAGMLTPTRGTITVLGERPAAGPAQLARVGFVAQDTAVYARMTVADHLRLGAWLNPGWDDELARRRIGQLALDPKQRAGSLSGGQRAQLALTLAMAKRPELLILDEPVASLDPLARREFLQRPDGGGRRAAASASCCPPIWSLTWNGSATTWSCSSPPGSGSPGRSATCWPRITACPGRAATPAPSRRARRSSTESHTDKQSSLLVRTDEPILDPAWTVKPVSMEDLVLGLHEPGRRRHAGPQSARWEWCHDPAQHASVPHPGRRPRP